MKNINILAVTLLLGSAGVMAAPPENTCPCLNDYVENAPLNCIDSLSSKKIRNQSSEIIFVGDSGACGTFYAQTTRCESLLGTYTDGVCVRDYNNRLPYPENDIRAARRDCMATLRVLNKELDKLPDC